MIELGRTEDTKRAYDKRAWRKPNRRPGLRTGTGRRERSQWWNDFEIVGKTGAEPFVRKRSRMFGMDDDALRRLNDSEIDRVVHFDCFRIAETVTHGSVTVTCIKRARPDAACRVDLL